MQQNSLGKLCRCGRKHILTGEKAKYNARSTDGTQICTDCLMEEIRSSIKHG